MIMDVLKYLEKRQLGYAGKNVYDMFIEQMGCLPRNIGRTGPHNDSNIITNTGNTFACKFSRNKNNLHMVGCSTEHGEIIIENTFNNFDSTNEQFSRNRVHDNAIFNFAWAEPQMKLVTACGDQTSKLCSLNPSGKLVEEREFLHNSSVKSVMFCPGSSNIFCGGCQDGSIKIWDVRINNDKTVIQYDHNIPNAHALYGPKLKAKKTRRKFAISSVIFKNDQTVISCSSMESAIKVWDLRKSYRQVKINTEPLPLLKYQHPLRHSVQNTGFTDIILNPESTHVYGSGYNNVIYCYMLDSTEQNPICQYSGYSHETSYSKISMSYDGRYLFSGCMDRSGVIWRTNFPYIEKPVFEIINKTPSLKVELSTSDWCADSTCMKLVVSADSMPAIFTVLTDEQKQWFDLKISRTPLYKLNSRSRNFCTVPIKFDVKLKEKYSKETGWQKFNKNKWAI